MRTTIDSAGRVVIPKQIRDHLRLSGGTQVDIVEVDGLVEIRLAPHKVTVDREGERPRLLAEGHGTPPLTDSDVRDLLDELRQWPRSL